MDSSTQKQQKKDMLYGSISILVLLIIVMSMGRRLIYFILGSTTMNGTFILIAELFYWFSLLFIWFYALKIEKQNLLIWLETRYGFWMHIRIILSIFGIIFLIAIPVMIPLNYFHLIKESAKATELRTILQANRPLLFFAALTAGVTEEFIFRGYLLPRFEFIFSNSYAAIILSSVPFGLLHLGYGTLSQVVGPLIIGLVLGYYYWKFRNIAIVIICHFLWDFISLSLTIKPH